MNFDKNRQTSGLSINEFLEGMVKSELDYDLIIVGAGPAGCSAAIALAQSNLKVLLLDKDNFPRDKICGDAIPDWAFNDLEYVSPGFRKEFLDQCKPHTFNRSSIITPNGRKLTMNWTRPGYMLPRRQFDSYLLDKVVATGKITLKQSCKVEDVISLPNENVLVKCSHSSEFTARIVIGADGPKSVVSKKLAAYTVKVNQFGSALRAYYSNANVEDETESMVFVEKKYRSGYFWIFPLGGGRVNVGFGMLHKKRNKINSRKAFLYFLEHNKAVREIMNDAVPDSDIGGGGLPFALKRRKLSGPNFILVGDAASLVDPFSGDGIQNATKSGVLAATYAMKAINENRINADFLYGYDTELYKKLWPDLRKRGLMMKIGSIFPGLIYLGIRIGSFPLVHKWLKSWV